jgi:ribosomal protein S18 acetylase RimI-like enzyme
MMTAIIVRKAELKDVEIIADFNKNLAAETEGKNLNRETVVKGVTAVIKDPHKGFYLVAETRTDIVQLIGQLMITFEWSDWRNQCFWWIQSVYVPKKFRKQRVFSELYQYVVKMAKRGNVSELRLYVEKHNVSAKRVYKTLGMKKASYEIFEQELLDRLDEGS